MKEYTPLISEKEKQQLIEQQGDLEDSEQQGAFGHFKESLQGLGTIPRDLWLVYMVVFAQQYLMFGIWLITPFFLVEEFGFSDEVAGFVWGAMGGALSVYSILLGTVVDKWGVKTSIVIAVFLACLGGLVFAFSTHILPIFVSLMILIPLSDALATTAGTIAPRRFAHEKSRPMAFSLFFCTLQLSQAAGFGVDDAILLGSHIEFISKYRQIAIQGALICLCALLLCILIKETDVEASGETEISVLRSQPSSGEILKSILVTKSFWRFISLVIASIFCISAYGYLDSLLPKYMERTLGEGSMYGVITMINPLTQLIFAPLLTVLVYWYTKYTLMIIGALVIGGASFIPMMESSYQVFAFMAILTGVGESVFMPRFIEYTVSISPKGKEGTFAAFAGIPLTMGALLAGMTSGVFLEDYCPEDGSTNNCGMIWLIVGVICSSTFVLLCLFRFVLEEPVYDPQPILPCCDASQEIR